MFSSTKTTEISYLQYPRHCRCLANPMNTHQQLNPFIYLFVIGGVKMQKNGDLKMSSSQV